MATHHSIVVAELKGLMQQAPTGAQAAERAWALAKAALALYPWSGELAQLSAYFAYYAGHEAEAFRAYFLAEMHALWATPLKDNARFGWQAAEHETRCALATVAIPQSWPAPAMPIATLTMTTCKRRALFSATVRSLLLHCTDLARYIGRWVVVDDGSSAEDRAAMQAEFPFIEYVFKAPEQKGHAHSMNLLLKHILTPYAVHVEDDFLFLHPYPLIGHALEILEAEPNCGQVLFCANYAELPNESAVLAGGVWKHLPTSARTYAVHEYAATPAARAAHEKRWEGRPSSSYWPHFSLRPGLWAMDRMRRAGWFDPNAAHFEMAFAQSYTLAGLVTAFLPSSTTCMHTGKHTSDPHGANAYTLNGVAQFVPAGSRGHTVQLAVWIGASHEAWAAAAQEWRSSVHPIQRVQAGPAKGLAACHTAAWHAFATGLGAEPLGESERDWLLVLGEAAPLHCSGAELDTLLHTVLEHHAESYDIVFLEAVRNVEVRAVESVANTANALGYGAYLATRKASLTLLRSAHAGCLLADALAAALRVGHVVAQGSEPFQGSVPEGH